MWSAECLGAGGSWRQTETVGNCGGVGGTAGKAGGITEHRMVIAILCSATKRRLLAVKNQFPLIVSLCTFPL